MQRNISEIKVSNFSVFYYFVLFFIIFFCSVFLQDNTFSLKLSVIEIVLLC